MLLNYILEPKKRINKPKLLQAVPNIKNMKVAITATGNTLESTLDTRFGRCAYFFIYDIENKIMEFIPNTNVALDEGAGTASVQFVASRNVKKIISGEFGLKIKPVLDSLKIQMIVLKNPEKKIKEIIEMLHR